MLNTCLLWDDRKPLHVSSHFPLGWDGEVWVFKKDILNIKYCLPSVLAGILARDQKPYSATPRFLFWLQGAGEWLLIFLLGILKLKVPEKCSICQ